MRAWLVLGLLITPFSQPVPQRQSSPQKQASQAKQPAKAAAPTTIVKASQSTSARDENADKNKGYSMWQKAFAPETWPAWGLVAVGIVAISLTWRTLGTLRKQADAAVKAADAALLNAQALMNAERAWVVAELRPYAKRASDRRWYRQDGTALTTEEVSAGKHLLYWLTITNIGRGPAQILGFAFVYTCLGEGVTDLPESGGGERVLKSYRSFEHLLGADSETIELEGLVIDVGHFMGDDFEAIKELKKTAVIHGWIKYRHMLSTTEDCYADFCYVYTVSQEKLTTVGRHTKQRQEKAN